MADRAASEVLGFVLVFSVVVATVAIISFAGIDTLEDARDREELNNAERAFDVLADNMADIHEEGAPSRATEISLENSQLYTSDTVTINITVFPKTGDPSFRTYDINPIVFASGDTEIIYAAGAIIRAKGDSGVMLKSPPVVLDEQRMIFPVVQTNFDGNVSSTGGQTVRVRAVRVARRPISQFTTSQSENTGIRINVTSDRSGVWKDYFEAQGSFVNCTQPRPDKVSCNVGSPSQLYVSKTLINFAIES